MPIHARGKHEVRLVPKSVLRGLKNTKASFSISFSSSRDSSRILLPTVFTTERASACRFRNRKNSASAKFLGSHTIHHSLNIPISHPSFFWEVGVVFNFVRVCKETLRIFKTMQQRMDL